MLNTYNLKALAKSANNLPTTENIANISSLNYCKNANHFTTKANMLTSSQLLQKC